MIVLGIETSCDETSVGIVKDGRELLACVTASSMDIHAQYGGVVPEIAAREHIQAMTPTLDAALKQGQMDWSSIDAVAVTYGAGLGGSLLIGVLTARTLAITKNKPLYAINHVEGHVYANFITSTPLPSYVLPSSQPAFPCLALIVSGGHTQLALFRDHFDYQLLGQTHDDAIGEAFDKVAKMLGLPYPGGPSIAKAAQNGNADTLTFPKAKMENRYDFSFSGLKTAVLRAAQSEAGVDHTFPSFKLSGRLSDAQKANLAASFQKIAIETVVDKTCEAFTEFQPRSVVIAGGVAASQELRHQLEGRLTKVLGLQDLRRRDLLTSRAGNTATAAQILQYTDPKLCTDNGAMIATLGCFKAMHNQPTADPYSLDIYPNLSM